MSILNTTSATNYMLDIPDHGLTRNIQMQVQTYIPPVIEIPMTKVPNPMMGKSIAMYAGTAFIYKPIRLSILVDKSLEVWREVYQWALAIENYRSFRNNSFESTSGLSAFVHILDNHKNETVAIHEFVNPFPHLIYPPTFNHSAGSDYPMIMTIELGYSVFNVLDGKGNPIIPRSTIEDARDHEYENRKTEHFKNPNFK